MNYVGLTVIQRLFRFYRNHDTATSVSLFAFPLFLNFEVASDHNPLRYKTIATSVSLDFFPFNLD